MESIFKLGILLSVVDKVTGPASGIGKGMDTLRGKTAALGPVFDKFKTYGVRAATTGALLIHMLSGTVMATVDTQKALGELSSVGIQNLGALEKAGREFSGQWSGTTKAQFISAAYDIKSGISSLTDSGVAEFTKLAALTGKATKSTTAEMTSLFATGYGIYKDMYGSLSDMQFGQVFSAGIAASVKNFKTTGSGMAQAISTLGAVATTAKVPMEEQLSILGMLQATMTGSEAGTKYKALMQAAAGAGEKLNLKFMDSNNQLLSMPQILTALKGKYGDTLDAIEKLEIQKAFGTQEAVAVIDLLYGKVGSLTDSTRSLAAAMRSGTGFTQQMASAMNQDIGQGIALLGQRSHNLKEVIGKQLIPVLSPLFSAIGNMLIRVTEFAEKHGTLTRVFVVSLAVISALAFGIGSLAAIVGTAGLVWPVMVTGLAAVTGAVWGFTAALLANPITWVVAGIAGLIVALVVLYKKFEVVRDIGDSVLYFLGFLAGGVVTAGKAIITILTHPLEFMRFLLWGAGRAIELVIEKLAKFAPGLKAVASLLLAFVFPPLAIALNWDSIKKGAMMALDWIKGLVPRFLKAGAKLWGALVSGIKSKLMVPVDIVKGGLQKLRNLLPFSDAREGPLSALTLSGQRIMQTLGSGIRKAAPDLKTVAQGALAGVTAATLIASPATMNAASAAPVTEQVVQQVLAQDVQAKAVEAPKLPNVAAQAVWSAFDIDKPDMPDATANAAWKAQPVETPKLPDVAAKAVWNALGIKKPDIPDVTANAAWKPQSVKTPKMPDVAAKAVWTALGIDKPNVPDVTANAAWNAHPIETPKLPDVGAQAVWTALGIDMPEISDLTAKAAWQTQGIEKPVVPKVQDKVIPQTETGKQREPDKSQGRTKSGDLIVKGDLNISLPNVTDAKSLIEELREFIGGYDA